MSIMWTENLVGGSWFVIQYKWPIDSGYFTDEQVTSCVCYGWSHSVDTVGWSYLFATRVG